MLHHAVSGKRVRRTPLPSVHSSESGSWNKIMSCVLSRTLKVRRNPRRTDPLFVVAAVKKMAPESREAIGPEFHDECLLSRGAMVQKSPMHAYS